MWHLVGQNIRWPLLHQPVNHQDIRSDHATKPEEIQVPEFKNKILYSSSVLGLWLQTFQWTYATVTVKCYKTDHFFTLKKAAFRALRGVWGSFGNSEVEKASISLLRAEP